MTVTLERDPFSNGYIAPAIDQATKYAIDRMAGSTNHPVDNRANVLLLRALTGPEYDYALTLILARRRKHLVWNTMTQRKWQTKISRRPGRARHHDSLSIRDLYVRFCGSEHKQHQARH